MAKNQVTSKALTEVEIDGRKAEDVITELEQKAQSYRKAMVEAQKANDKIAFDKASKSAKEYDQAIKSVKKGTTDVNAVMKNLSGATMNQLTAAQSKLTKELKNTTRGTQEWIDKTKQLKAVKDEIKKVSTEMSGTAGAQSNLWGKLGGVVMKFAGFAAAAFGAIKSGEKIIKSAQGASDKWEVEISGINFGLQAMMKSLANMDFTNWTQNISIAVKAGREYAKMLDDLGDKVRDYRVEESEAAIEVAKLERIRDNVQLSNQERVNAAIAINKIEENDLKKNLDIKQQTFNAEITRVKAYSKLSEEEIKTYIKQYTEQAKLRAEAEEYNAAQKAIELSSKNTAKAFDLLTGSQADFAAKMGISGKVLEALKENVRNAPADVVKMANAIKGINFTNDDELNKLVDAWTGLNAAELTYYTNTKKNQNKLNTLEKELADEKIKNKEEAFKINVELLDNENKKRQLQLTTDYNSQKITADEFYSQMLIKDWSYLNAKMLLYKSFGEDTIDIQQTIADTQLKINEDLAKSAIDVEQQIEKDNAAFWAEIHQEILTESAETAKLMEEGFKANSDKLGEDLKKMQKDFEEMKETAKQYSMQFGTSIGDALGTLMSDQEDAQEQFKIKMISIALDALDAMVNIAIGRIWAESMVQTDSVVSFGATGVIRAAIITGLLKAATAGIRSAVMSSVSQNYEGRYDVTGAQDGKHYNVPYIGSPQTGLVMNPSLISERGPEIIIDAERSRNIRMRYPQLMDAIKAVPQHAAGTLGGTTPTSTVTQANDSELKNLLAQNNAVIAALQQQLQRGITADISYKHMKTKTEKAQRIEQRTNRRG